MSDPWDDREIEPIRLLDPKNDAVFKMMLTAPECEESLLELITAIIKPSRPLLRAKVRNPVISKDHITDKDIALDILVDIDGGLRVNIEMQMVWHHCLEERALYYLARAYSSQLRRGFKYSRLRPTYAIFILNDNGLSSRIEDFHLQFELEERERRARLKGLMALHMIELPKLIRALRAGLAGYSADDLNLWGRFLYNPEDPIVESAVRERSGLKKAKEKLKELSSTAEARQIARMRADGRRDYLTDMWGEREAGRKEGRAEGTSETRYALLENLLVDPDLRHLPLPKLAQLTGLSEAEIAEFASARGLSPSKT